MKKILHINCTSTGSTGKIIGDIAANTTEAGYTHLLCCPGEAGEYPDVRYIRTSVPYEQGLYRRLNYAYGFQYGFAPLSTWKIKEQIKKEKPDLIHLHCLNGFMVNIYSLLRLMKKRRIPTVITNHAEFYYTGSCPHAYECEKWMTGCGHCPQVLCATGGKLLDTSHSAWKKMKKAFGELSRAEMVSVSPWVSARAARSPITMGIPQSVVLNGVNTNHFFYRDPVKMRQKYGISPDTRVLFHPTAYFSDAESDPKGGRYILALADRLAEQDVCVVVAGNTVPGMTVPANVRLLGRLSSLQLAEYYALSDVTVVVGKRETFNLPVAESLCCGTPVAGFCAGGPESITMDAYSQFVPYGDLDQLEEAIDNLLAQPFDRKTLAEKATQKYAATTMAAGYLEIYRRLLGNRSM